MLIQLPIVFFFQAEDGIRDTSVTGVQTCALPIYTGTRLSKCPRCEKLIYPRKFAFFIHVDGWGPMALGKTCKRSEERRVGKECRAPRRTYAIKKILSNIREKSGTSR